MIWQLLSFRYNLHHIIGLGSIWLHCWCRVIPQMTTRGKWRYLKRASIISWTFKKATVYVENFFHQFLIEKLTLVLKFSYSLKNHRTPVNREALRQMLPWTRIPWGTSYLWIFAGCPLCPDWLLHWWSSQRKNSSKEEYLFRKMMPFTKEIKRQLTRLCV